MALEGSLWNTAYTDIFEEHGSATMESYSNQLLHETVWLIQSGQSNTEKVHNNYYTYIFRTKTLEKGTKPNRRLSIRKIECKLTKNIFRLRSDSHHYGIKILEKPSS